MDAKQGNYIGIGVAFVAIAALAVVAFRTVDSPPAADEAKSVGVHNARLTLAPDGGEYRVGDEWSVALNLETDGAPVDGVDVIISYDPDKIDILGSGAMADDSALPFTVLNSINRAAGTLSFSAIAKPGTTFTGSGHLADIMLIAKAVGEADVRIVFEGPDGHRDSNVAAFAGTDILREVAHARYLITK